MLTVMDESESGIPESGEWRPPHGRKTRWVAWLILLMIVVGVIVMLIVGVGAMLS